MTPELLDRITIEAGKCGGHPCIRGLRIRVSQVISMVAEGMTAAEIVQDYPDLQPDDIKASLLYAAMVLDKPRIAA
jgi:uncharacterized protein (DUF433 family)